MKLEFEVLHPAPVDGYQPVKWNDGVYSCDYEPSKDLLDLHAPRIQGGIPGMASKTGKAAMRDPHIFFLWIKSIFKDAKLTKGTIPPLPVIPPDAIP